MAAGGTMRNSAIRVRIATMEKSPFARTVIRTLSTGDAAQPGAYLVAYGKTKLGRGQRLRGVVQRTFKHAVPGVYRTFIVVRSLDDPRHRVVLSLRPQVVKANRADLTQRPATGK